MSPEALSNLWGLLYSILTLTLAGRVPVGVSLIGAHLH